MTLELIYASIMILGCLFGSFLGVWIIARIEGKFKVAMVFLLAAVIIYGLKGITALIYTLKIINWGEFYFELQSFAAILIIIFLIGAMYELKNMIEKLERKMNGRKKK